MFFFLTGFGPGCNHIYYCILGDITFECSEGTNRKLMRDSLLAMTGTMTGLYFEIWVMVTLNFNFLLFIKEVLEFASSF